MESERLRRSARARPCCEYPVCSIANSTRARVRSLTGRVPLTTCDTVDVDTLARRATSVIVFTDSHHLADSRETSRAIVGIVSSAPVIVKDVARPEIHLPEHPERRDAGTALVHRAHFHSGG